MKSLARHVLFAMLLLAVAAPAVAQEGKKKRSRRGPRTDFSRQSIVERLKYLDLTAEQTTKLEALQNEYSKKFAASRKSLQGIYTDEFRQAIRKAYQEAREKGLSGEERRKAIQGAGILTDDQRAALKKSRDLRDELNQAIDGLLTTEQKAKRAQRRKERSDRFRRPRNKSDK